MPTVRTVESEAQTYELATRIPSGSFIPALQAWMGTSTAALMTPETVRRATTPHHPDQISFWMW